MERGQDDQEFQRLAENCQSLSAQRNLASNDGYQEALAVLRSLQVIDEDTVVSDALTVCYYNWMYHMELWTERIAVEQEMLEGLSWCCREKRLRGIRKEIVERARAKYHFRFHPEVDPDDFTELRALGQQHEFLKSPLPTGDRCAWIWYRYVLMPLFTLTCGGLGVYNKYTEMFKLFRMYDVCVEDPNIRNLMRRTVRMHRIYLATGILAMFVYGIFVFSITLKRDKLVHSPPLMPPTTAIGAAAPPLILLAPPPPPPAGVKG